MCATFWTLTQVCSCYGNGVTACFLYELFCLFFFRANRVWFFGGLSHVGVLREYKRKKEKAEKEKQRKKEERERGREKKQ